MALIQGLRVLRLTVLPTCLHAQPMPRPTDAQVMREARLVASSGRVDLYGHRISDGPDIAAAADREPSL